MATPVISIPYQQTSDRQFNLFEKQLAQALQPLTSQPQALAITLTGVSLTSGSVNKIATTLGRRVQGWYLVRIRGQATVWDTQDNNNVSTSPDYDTRLYLNTSANVVVDLVVF